MGVPLRGLICISIFVSVVLFSLPNSLKAQASPPAVSADIIIQHDVPMKTRDGVTLYADIYRPKSSEKFPVILMRTP